MASDGGIFDIGDATYHGPNGSLKLNRPIVGMAAGPNNSGYRPLASDGGIFAFDVTFYGSLPGSYVTAEATGSAPAQTRLAYLASTSPGGVFSFGDAPAPGAIAQVAPGFSGRIIGVAGQPSA